MIRLALASLPRVTALAASCQLFGAAPLTPSTVHQIRTAAVAANQDPLVSGDAHHHEALRAAELFYKGWDTGDTRYFTEAAAPTFFDNTLPSGRPQGPGGLESASKAFRKTVPDLRCHVRRYVVADGYVTAYMTFTGTSTSGKFIDFRAIDLLHIRDGRIIEDWHIEDMQTFEKQLGR